MSINFISPAVFVNDIEVSRSFYEEKLGQKVEMDAGQYVMFKGGFSLWQYQSAYQIIFQDHLKKSIPNNRESFELYFETANLEKAWESVVAGEVKVLHPIKEHSWGQRGFRVYDPDGYIVEVGEPISSVVLRFLQEGLTVGEISSRTFVPEEIVRGIAEKNGR